MADAPMPFQLAPPRTSPSSILGKVQKTDDGRQYRVPSSDSEDKMASASEALKCLRRVLNEESSDDLVKAFSGMNWLLHAPSRAGTPSRINVKTSCCWFDAEGIFVELDAA
ncbi:hypothetical protein IW261DRAFT_1598320 [Armillaria novae-zelandiae]|uniref:Uncharacterized protein n=1 Tax=Armillaria novae-zelandiae TaxID=153914 RepID=A0AA39TU98_9AGAR|nr:hypothetical protein IW261DRAFT_1598320 [Armillaria novae-zelandiae]